MTFCRISDRYPNYRADYFSGHDIKGMAVYSLDSHKVGKVVDILIDDTDCIKYLVIRIKSWFEPSREVLLPVSRYAHNCGEDMVYIHTMTRDEIKLLPQYQHTKLANRDYEATLQKIYNRSVLASSYTA